MDYIPIIGFEVHVELATKSKMFCGCPGDHFGKAPNTQTCPVCLGLPGALPVPNRQAVEWTMLLGLALGCEISMESKFDRKHYFYPDLPKGYQISQYDQPIAVNGLLRLRTQDVGLKEWKTIRIRRVHLEEDTGKLLHKNVNGKNVALVDFNRSGVPLVEIVTEPDFRNIEDVDEAMKKLQQIIRNLKISGADMEKGSMRLEPSISLLDLRLKTSDVSAENLPKYRVELKNINSFRFVRKALEFEIARQTRILDRGETPVQQTRGWSESKNETVAQREKEEAHDYRYFPEPDIPPMRFTDEYIEALRNVLPETVEAALDRLKDLGLPDSYLTILSANPQLRVLIENSYSLAQEKHLSVSAKKIADVAINKKADNEDARPEEILSRITESQAYADVSIDELRVVVDEVLASNLQAGADYLAGKTQALSFLLGVVMKKMSGKIDPVATREYVRKRLETSKEESEK